MEPPLWPAPVAAPVEPVAAAPDAAASRTVRRPWLFWGGIALVVIGVVGAIGDWGARTFELTRLVTAIEQSEAAMADAQDAIGAVDLPQGATDEQQQAAESELARVSAQGRDEVADAADVVRSVSFLPWHTELIRAQGAYLDHNGAWVSYLDRGAADPMALFGEDTLIDATWRSAETAVRAAQAFPALPQLSARINEIFTDEPADDGSSPDSGGLGA